MPIDRPKKEKDSKNIELKASGEIELSNLPLGTSISDNDLIPYSDMTISTSPASKNVTAQKLKQYIGPMQQIQSDWSQIDSESVDFIKNKPPIETLQYDCIIDNVGGQPFYYATVQEAVQDDKSFPLITENVEDTDGIDLQGNLQVFISRGRTWTVKRVNLIQNNITVIGEHNGSSIFKVLDQDEAGTPIIYNGLGLQRIKFENCKIDMSLVSKDNCPFSENTPLITTNCIAFPGSANGSGFNYDQYNSYFDGLLISTGQSTTTAALANILNVTAPVIMGSLMLDASGDISNTDYLFTVAAGSVVNSLTMTDDASANDVKILANGTIDNFNNTSSCSVNIDINADNAFIACQSGLNGGTVTISNDAKNFLLFNLSGADIVIEEGDVTGKILACDAVTYTNNSTGIIRRALNNDVIGNDYSGGGGGGVDSVSGNIVDNADPANPVITQVQADWDQAAGTEKDFIKNKPNLSLYAPLASPTFTGSVNVPTPADGDNTTKASNTQFVVKAISDALAGLSTLHTAFVGTSTAPGFYAGVAQAYAAGFKSIVITEDTIETGNILLSANDVLDITVLTDVSWDLGAFTINGTELGEKISIKLQSPSSAFKYSAQPFTGFDALSSISIVGNGGVVQNTSTTAGVTINTEGYLNISNVQLILPNQSNCGFETNNTTFVSNIVLVGGGSLCEFGFIASGGKISGLVITGTWKTNAILNTVAQFTNIEGVNYLPSIPCTLQVMGNLTNAYALTGPLIVNALSQSNMTNIIADSVLLEADVSDCSFNSISLSGSVYLAQDNSNENIVINGCVCAEAAEIYGQSVKLYACTFNNGFTAFSGSTGVIDGCTSGISPTIEGTFSLTNNDSVIGNDIDSLSVPLSTTISYTNINTGYTLLAAPGAGFKIVLDDFSIRTTAGLSGTGDVQLGDSTNNTAIFAISSVNFTVNSLTTASSSGVSNNMPAAELSENEPLVITSSTGALTVGNLKVLIQYRIVKA